ncbi:hypothetical protein Q7P37_003390 [Cladosporium fusiforme]
MSGRIMAFIGPVLATGFGIFTAYSTFQPELEKERAIRESKDPIFAQQVTPAQHDQHTQAAQDAQRDTAISRAMAKEFQEAGEQVKAEGGFAWGIRKAVFGSGKEGEQEKK